MGETRVSREDMFDKSAVVKFPINMGVNGFSFKTNSVSYFNNKTHVLGARKCYPNLYEISGKIIPK